MKPEHLKKAIEEARRRRHDLAQPEMLERIIKAVQAELGEDYPDPAIATGMVMAAGYMQQRALGGLINGWKKGNELSFLKGAKVYGCKCPECTAKKQQAMRDAAALLRKAAGNG